MTKSRQEVDFAATYSPRLQPDDFKKPRKFRRNRVIAGVTAAAISGLFGIGYAGVQAVSASQKGYDTQKIEATAFEHKITDHAEAVGIPVDQAASWPQGGASLICYLGSLFDFNHGADCTGSEMNTHLSDFVGDGVNNFSWGDANLASPLSFVVDLQQGSTNCQAQVYLAKVTANTLATGYSDGYALLGTQQARRAYAAIEQDNPIPAVQTFSNRAGMDALLGQRPCDTVDAKDYDGNIGTYYDGNGQILPGEFNASNG